MIRVIQLFDSYPLFYQPYIPPVLEALQNDSQIDLSIYAYSGGNSTDINAIIIPSYYRRILIEKAYAFKYKGLNYLEIQALKTKTDIIHIQHSFLFPKIKNLVKLQLENKPKVIVTLRGGDTYVKPYISNKWVDFFGSNDNGIDAFVTMSEHQKKYLQKWGVPEQKIHIIPISFGHSSKAKPKYPNANKLKLISAFRMCWEKNIDGNLRVAKLLKEKGVNFQYDIYGDGPDKGQVLYLIDKYNLRDCCFYHGKIKNKNFKLRLKEYDILLQLSHSESLSSSVLEAQAYGLPCIVSDSGGLPEVIINNKTGYSVGVDEVELAVEKMIGLYSNRETYFAFSKEAISYVNSNFTVQHETDRLTALYKELKNK